LLGCGSGSRGGSAIALRFGLSGLLLLESRGLCFALLALGLVTCANGFSGVGFGADCLSLGIGFAIRCRPGFGVNALRFYALDRNLAGVFCRLYSFAGH
jgi:hypothetical protein